MKILAAAALGAALLLPNCAGFTPPTADSIKTFIENVNRITRAGCGFIADADVIVAIVNNNIVTGVYGVADAICAAILATPPAPAGRMAGAPAARPRVGSVVITGRFVSKAK